MHLGQKRRGLGRTVSEGPPQDVDLAAPRSERQEEDNGDSIGGREVGGHDGWRADCAMKFAPLPPRIVAT